MKKKQFSIRKYKNKTNTRIQVARLTYMLGYDGIYTIYAMWKHEDGMLPTGKVFKLTIQTRSKHITVYEPITKPYPNWHFFLRDWFVLKKADYQEALLKKMKQREEAKIAKLPFRFRVR